MAGNIDVTVVLGIGRGKEVELSVPATRSVGDVFRSAMREGNVDTSDMRRYLYKVNDDLVDVDRMDNMPVRAGNYYVNSTNQKAA